VLAGHSIRSSVYGADPIERLEIIHRQQIVDCERILSTEIGKAVLGVEDALTTSESMGLYCITFVSTAEIGRAHERKLRRRYICVRSGGD
jgi:hypothetical protein